MLVWVLSVILEKWNLKDKFYDLAGTKWWCLIAKDKVARVAIMNVQQSQSSTQNNLTHRNS